MRGERPASLSRSSTVRFACAVLAASSVLAACMEPDRLTQLVVSVDTDVPVPSELFGIGFRVERGDPDDGGTTAGNFENFVDGVHRGARGLPLSLNIVAASAGPLDVVVFGRLRDTVEGEHTVERRVRVVPVRDQARLLCVVLERACVDATCDGDLTCVRGVCVPPQLDAASLPIIARIEDASCP